MQLWIFTEDKMIRLLVEGFLRRENGQLLESHSTATAVIQDDFILLVDTSSKECRSKLLHSKIFQAVEEFTSSLQNFSGC